jgi:hypothetical protein
MYAYPGRRAARVRDWQPEDPNLYHAYHGVWIDSEVTA